MKQYGIFSKEDNNRKLVIIATSYGVDKEEFVFYFGRTVIARVPKKDFYPYELYTNERIEKERKTKND